MSTPVKVTLSILGVFLGGLTTSYSASPDGPWIGWVMAGLVPVASYLVGFSQLNPTLTRPGETMKGGTVKGGKRHGS